MRFLITYCIEIFYFHISHEDFYGLSNNVLHVLGTRLILYVLATLKLAIAMWYIQSAQIMECFSWITSGFPNYLLYRKFLFSHISWRFLWSFKQCITCPGDWVISVCFGILKYSHCNVIYSKRAIHGMFLINNKCVS